LNLHKPILVTGGAGYIGSTLVRDLLQNGYPVRVIDNFTYTDYGIRDLLGRSDFQVVQGDVRNKKEVFQVAQGVEAVIHLAGASGDESCNADPKACYEVNILGTQHIVEACEAYQVPRLAFSSSCSVYGASVEIVDETTPPKPLTLYARTKLEAEKRVLASQIPCPTVFRIATVFGLSGRSRLDLVLNLLTVKAQMEKRITIFGGDQWRPLIHVKDVSRAFLLWLTASESVCAHQIFNLGSNTLNFSIRDLAEKIHSVIPTASLDFRLLQADMRDYRVNFDKIHHLFQFTPQHSIEEGIQEVREGLLSGLIPDYRDPRYSTIGRKLA